jgi:hypothetical protein
VARRGSGGFERGQGLEDGDLFSPVRLHFGRFTANERGIDNNGETVSGTTQEAGPEEETPNGAQASGVTTQRIAQGSAVQ